MVQRYGQEFPDDADDLLIELMCYDAALTESDGGLGAHGHLRRAMWLAFPDVYGPKGEHWHDWVELLVWAWCWRPPTCPEGVHRNVIAVMGHSRAGKTHDCAHIVALHFLVEAALTIITLTTVTVPGLKDRLWSDAVKACTRFPGLTINHYKLKITAAGSLTDKFSIEGIATGKDRQAVGKIQGNHAPRRALIVDEAQDTAPAVFDAMANLMTAPDFRAFLLANPVRKASPFGEWCEPLGGWSDPAYGNDWWLTKKGYIALHFDGLKAHNVKTGTRVFPWMIDQNYIDNIRTSFGEGSSRWWAYVRGLFPPAGLVDVVFNEAICSRMVEAIKFLTPATPCGALDPAFGGDRCMMKFGEYGAVEKGVLALNLTDSVTIPIDVGSKDSAEIQITRRVMAECVKRGVAPEDFICDRTGTGRGTHAFLLRDWSPDVIGCEFGGKPTERIVKLGDTDTCAKRFSYFVDELWFAARDWGEEGQIGNVGGVACGDLLNQLCNREYELREYKRVRLEDKEAYRDRMGESPDDADAFVMLIELLRRKGALAGRKSNFLHGTPMARSRAIADKVHEADDRKTAYSHPPPSWNDDFPVF